MNIFFYAASTSKCGEGCCYQTCTGKCLALLNQVPVLNDMSILPGGSKLQTPVSMELRSGDILLLYAADETDLADLLSLKGYIDSFRIILIVGSDELTQSNEYHQLMPRYTTTLNQSMEKLGAVIQRMNSQRQNLKNIKKLPKGHYHG